MCKLVKYSGSKNARSTAFDTHIATWVLVKDVIYEGVGMSVGKGCDIWRGVYECW